MGKLKQSLVICLALLLTLPSCYSTGVLKKKDYIQMTDDAVRATLLQHIPIGSSDAVARKVMKRDFHSPLEKLGVYRDQDVIDKTRIFRGQIRQGDYTLRTVLASYGGLRYFFLMNMLVIAVFLFDNQGLLKDIHVERYGDGV